MRRASRLLVALVVAWLWLALPTGTFAQSPASPAPVTTTTDPRSNGEGPGIVGSPVEIALAIVGLGLVTIAGTVVLVRLSQRRPM